MSPKQNKTYEDYVALKLKPGASLESIKNSYKTLAKIWHPDLFPSNQPKAQEEAHRMFRLITESYSRLTKYYEESSNKNYSRTYQEHTPFEYQKESANKKKDESDSKTIEMVDRKWPDGTRYEGMSLNGKFHGRGIYTYPNGDIYTGEFYLGKIQGQGQFNFKNGDKYLGAVYKNQMHGQGKMTFATGGHYIGQFANNQFHGQGVLATPDKINAGSWDSGIFLD